MGKPVGLSLALILLNLGLCFMTMGCSRYLPAVANESQDANLPKTRELELQAVDPDAGPQCRIFQGASNLKYYGPYCSSCSWVGRGSYLDEIKQFSNTAWVTSTDLDFMVRELTRAREAGLFAVVSPLGLLSLDNLNSELWLQDARRLAPFVQSGTIVAFYMADDRFDGKTVQQIRMVKSSFPQIPSAAFVIDYYGTSVPILPEIDWIGIEEYSGDWGQFDKFVRNLYPHQQIMLIPGVFAFGNLGGTDMSSRLPSLIDPIFAQATNNPRVVGVFPFIWQSHHGDFENLTGASELPGYREKVSEMGRCFGRSSVVPPQPQPPTQEPGANTPAIGYLDSVDFDGNVLGWALDPSQPTASIDVRIIIDPDPNRPSGGLYFGGVKTQVLRTDVNRVMGVSGRHGFYFHFPISLRDGQEHRIHAYAIARDGSLTPLIHSGLSTRPAQHLTRGQVAYLALYGRNGCYSYDSTSTSDPQCRLKIGAWAYFRDVGLNHPYFGLIQKFFELGFTKGKIAPDVSKYIQGFYGVDDLVTRGEAAVFYMRISDRAAGLPNDPPIENTSPAYFADVPVGHPFFSYIQRMREMGLAPNCGRNSEGKELFCPNEVGSRRDFPITLESVLSTSL